MAITAITSPRDVSTTLNYYTPIGTEAPYYYVDTPPPDTPQHNIGADTRPVIVHDVRDRESEYTLDKNGFQWVRHVSAEKEFVDEEKVKREYYPEVVELVRREVPGAKRVFIFDHTIRRGAKDEGPGKRGPVERVHVDQTFESTIARVHDHLGPEAPRLLQSRIRLINVWRPIQNPVYHKPLAVSDWNALDITRDLIPSKRISKERVGETFSVKYNPDHRWYYLSEQTPEEVTLIKCFDSEVDRARLTPHTAFTDSTSPEDAPLRQSIEVRCLVFDSE
ncbi:methyltransferase [Panus rudis PR-1116 ss-1]|nr:methyltransferase [Panus rudis PR-1116 ss-1]